MKGWSIAVAIAVAMGVSATPAQAKKEVVVVVNNGVYQFVGYSDGTTNGGQGFIHMHRLCQADFGDAARMCTTEEFFKSPNAADPVEENAPTDDAWIHVFDGESTGAFQPQACTWWSTSSSGSRGTVVPSKGQITTVFCNSLLGVTCCAPLQ